MTGDTRTHLLFATCTTFCTNILVTTTQKCSFLVDPPPPSKSPDGVKQTSVRFIKSSFPNNPRHCKNTSTADENHDHLCTTFKQETVYG